MKVQSGLMLSKDDLTFYKVYSVLKEKVRIFFNAYIYTYTCISGQIYSHYSNHFYHYLHLKVSGSAGKFDLVQEPEKSFGKTNFAFCDVELFTQTPA